LFWFRPVADDQVIKIISGGQLASDHPITEADRGALAVLGTLSRVDAQIADIEVEAADCQAKVKRQLGLGQRAAAASYLRSKKNLDDVLAKRVATGEQLRSVVRALDQAKGDAEVMSAYEASTAALASALSDPRLSPDRIAATTDALADALADQREIDDAVRLGGDLANPAIDEDELEKELAALVLEDKEEKEAKERKEREERAAADKKRADADAAAAAAAAAAKVLAPSVPSSDPGSKGTDAGTAVTPETQWADRHADAQQREHEERERAAAEQLKRDERLVAAE
jgi:charged multivesicular body protein 7